MNSSIVGYNFTTYDTYSASVWDDNEPVLTFDGDVTSCYKSGPEIDSFWKVVVPNQLTVNKVIISGK